MKPTTLSLRSICLLASLATGLASGSTQAQSVSPCDKASPSTPDLAGTGPAVSDQTNGPDPAELPEPRISAGTKDLRRLQAEMQRETPAPLNGDFSRDFTQEMTRQLEKTIEVATVGACRGDTPELRALAQRIVNVELEMKAELRRLRERELRQR